ncbi:MAG: ABC transporter permease, partial [Clostridia bacterium]
MAGSKRAKRGATTFFITLGSVLTAFVLSCLVLLVAGYNPLQAFSQMIVGVFSRPKYIAWTLLKAQPIILTGLSVAFAFKTGLFNIGAEGQFIAGMTAASLLGYLIHMPAVFPEWLSLIVHPTIVLALSMLVAGLYGGLVGLFKARFGMHEVISGIMLNWIAFYLHNAVVAAPFFSEQINKSYPVQPTASMVLFESWKKTAEGNAFFEGLPWLDEIFSTPI